MIPERSVTRELVRNGPSEPRQRIVAPDIFCIGEHPVDRGDIELRNVRIRVDVDVIIPFDKTGIERGKEGQSRNECCQGGDEKLPADIEGGSFWRTWGGCCRNRCHAEPVL